MKKVSYTERPSSKCVVEEDELIKKYVEHLAGHIYCNI